MVIATDGHLPYVSHFGADSGGDVTALHGRGVVAGGLDHDAPCHILPLAARGWMGRPGIEAFRASGAPTPCDLRYTFGLAKDDTWRYGATDDSSLVEVEGSITAHRSGVFEVRTRVTNIGDDDLHLAAVRPSLPVGAHASEIMTLGGRHAMEAVPQRTAWGRSTLVVENRSGRTSHERLGVVFVGTPGFGEQHGEVWGFHAAWSGNFEITCDGVTGDVRTVQVGELLAAGEVVLAPGESYDAPVVLAVHSLVGLNGVSLGFHRHARSMHGDSRTARPVICNTWEAVYFSHDLPTLMRLADRAAAVGAERFVLDDGWFHGRRNDTAGLGDWWVDEDVWPDGLTPLIDHVTGLGMDFGLWFEPEMVNPDSELFRAHPEWVLGTIESPTGRNQLVLDLGNPAVRAHLFDALDALLSLHPVSYVKWDHNRPLVGGRAHAQTLGYYELLGQLRRAHPSVQWESCASGGGRIDLAVAALVDRFWTSDSIDALDRLFIQRGMSTFVPPEMLGSHIGSPLCHTTGRRHRLAFRASTAMFGWLGIEWNLLECDDKELGRLADVVARHKEHRALIHSGDHLRIDHPDPTILSHVVVAADGAEAILSVSRTASGPTNHVSPVRIPGLDPDASYLVNVVDMGTPVWALHRELPAWMSARTVLSGRHLHSIGLVPPPLRPESTVLVSLTRQHADGIA